MKGEYMKIYGSIENSRTGSPVKGAKIELNIDNQENIDILSDDFGRFEYVIEGMHRMLYIKIEKEGYAPKNLTKQMDKPEVQVSILLDESYKTTPITPKPQPSPTPPPPEPKIIIVHEEKKWYIKDFLSITAKKMVNFLKDKIEEYRRKRGEDKQIEILKKKLAAYEARTELKETEIEDYGEIIKELEEKLGSSFISESAYVNWNLDKIKPIKSAFEIKVWVEEADRSDKRDIRTQLRPQTLKDFHVGEKINIFFKSEKDCYLNLWNFGTSGKLTVLFPNALFTDNFIKGNRIYSIPGEDYPFDYILSGPPGIERVKAIAANHKFNLIDLTSTKEEIFTTSKSAVRDISIAAKQIETKVETKEWKEWSEALCEISVV
jgi:hypothetical protein